MTPQVIVANPRLSDANGQVAIQRGPLVYCLEQMDQPNVPSLHDVVFVLGRNPGQEFQPEFRRDTLGGVVVLHHAGAVVRNPTANAPLYQLFSLSALRSTSPVPVTLIPYYAWANREPTAMQVWMPYVQR